MKIKSKKFLLFFLLLFTLTLCLIIFSYFFIDRQLASWIHSHHLPHFSPFIFMSQISKYLNGIAALSLIYFGIKRIWKREKIIEKQLFITALASLFSASIADTIKPFFGRYWPATWIGHNPSWIENKAYGFHFFHFGWSYASFPSGHTAIILGIGTSIWLTFPKWRWLSLILIIIEIIGLLGMNYHFLSDIFAGGFIGWLTAFFLHNQTNPNSESRDIL